MNLIQKSLTQLLGGILAREGFTRGRDLALRRWNGAGDICCTIALKVFTGGDIATVEIGFVSPQILNWFGIEGTVSPLPYFGNGYGVFYRLEDLGIRDGFIFPPGGWRIANNDDAESFKLVLERQLLQSLTPLLHDLLTWDGWVNHFRLETRRFPCGRAHAWALLGYSLLASPNRTAAEIQAVIDEHAQQDGSKRAGNRLDAEIDKQRWLLREREKRPGVTGADALSA